MCCMEFPNVEPKVTTELCPFGCGQIIPRFINDVERVKHFELVHRGEMLQRLRARGFHAEASLLTGSVYVYGDL